jgi:hypothetical protein
MVRAGIDGGVLQVDCVVMVISLFGRINEREALCFPSRYKALLYTYDRAL